MEVSPMNSVEFPFKQRQALRTLAEQPSGSDNGQTVAPTGNFGVVTTAAGGWLMSQPMGKWLRRLLFSASINLLTALGMVLAFSVVHPWKLLHMVHNTKFEALRKKEGYWDVMCENIFR